MSAATTPPSSASVDSIDAQQPPASNSKMTQRVNKKYLKLGIAALAVVALVIGLSVGLTSKNKATNNLSASNAVGTYGTYAIDDCESESGFGAKSGKGAKADSGSAKSDKMSGGSAKSDKMSGSGSAKSDKMSGSGSAKSDKMSGSGSAKSEKSETRYLEVVFDHEDEEESTEISLGQRRKLRQNVMRELQDKSGKGSKSAKSDSGSSKSAKSGTDSAKSAKVLGMDAQASANNCESGLVDICESESGFAPTKSAKGGSGSAKSDKMSGSGSAKSDKESGKGSAKSDKESGKGSTKSDKESGKGSTKSGKGSGISAFAPSVCSGQTSTSIDVPAPTPSIETFTFTPMPTFGGSEGSTPTVATDAESGYVEMASRDGPLV